ncbi:HAMP domain-containing sensor histidine kinase [Litoribacillus peritrichatus]|uniref:histidine kinase n=1 Tax=Litoribacillus peritrichatus TaxID=718191 RepID=A0ABP7MYK8_9GAMM
MNKIKPMSKSPVKTLAQQLRWQITLAGVVFVVVFIISLNALTLRSVDFAVDSFIKMEAHNLVKQLQLNPEMALPSEDSYQAVRNWESLPGFIQPLFPKDTIEDNEVYDAEYTDEQGVIKYVSLLRFVDQQGDSIYLLTLSDLEETEEVIGQIINHVSSGAIWVVAMIFVGLFMFVLWLLKRTNEPMVLLSEWAERLKANDQLNQDQFPIAELNDLAAQLKAGVDQITEYNLREQQFLKHASHELRTPLATIQACLDTLDFKLTGAEQTTVQRALKASLNMSRLSSALLWLARESEKPIDKSDVMLDAFCQQQVADHQYLIAHRPVEIQTQINADQIEIEEDLLLIVFANLLRNACQFTSEGIIKVTFDANALTIENPSDVSINASAIHTSVSEYQSFGLGLQLVERICHKLGWRFKYIEHPDHIQVTVIW